MNNDTKPRVFVYEAREYADPNPKLSNEQVRDMLARTFPALAGGTIDKKEEDGRTVVSFANRPQRKGCDAPNNTIESTREAPTKTAVIAAAINWYHARVAFDEAEGILPPEGNALVAAGLQLREAVAAHLSIANIESFLL